MSIYKNIGELIFGTRLKRISDKFLVDIAKTYQDCGINFEPSWFPVFYLLHEHGETSMREIADELEMSHSAISQMVSGLEQKKLLKLTKDKQDKRKRIVQFTPKGRQLLTEVVPVWEALTPAMKELLEEGENSRKLLSALDEVEASLEKEELYERVMKHLSMRAASVVEVIPYQAALAGDLQVAIDEWRKSSKNISFIDVAMCWENGGYIAIAKVREEVVGVIIINISPKKRAIIQKLFVSTSWRNRGVGKYLLQWVVDQQEQMDVPKIVIQLDEETNILQQPLERQGFQLIESEDLIILELNDSV